MEGRPQRAAILARISFDRAGDERGVTGQVQDARALARRLGWKVGPERTHVVVENDVSAYRRKKVRLPDGRTELRTLRPGFRQVLDLLACGAADGLIALDLDRAARDPRDLEDLIDVIESKVPRIPVESVTGSLKLANDADVAMSRVMVAIANKSSRDTSRRVSRAALARAMAGRYSTHGVSRQYGQEPDGSVREDEAKVIRQAAESLLSGISLSGVSRELNAKGVAPPRSKQWSNTALRQLLLQPRMAGLMTWHGEILEGVRNGEPVLERETWDAVRALLTDPSRKVSPGPTPRHLLSGLALCGHPSHPPTERMHLVHRLQGSRRYPFYVCLADHLGCAGDHLEEFVEGQVVDKLSRPDAAKLLVPRIEVDMAGLARQANSLRARITGLGDVLESGDMGPAEYRRRKARLAEQLAKVETEMTAAAGTSPLSGIAGRKDAGVVWTELDLARKRAVIDALMIVTVVPTSRRGRGIKISERVRISWRS